ncbi:MAG: DEAD/DEAH box helicase family protein [Alphaproteobacteria bacterium]|nr:DEAD/DEAH box helicase family protein [Alphaproteobacteria bacterium]
MERKFDKNPILNSPYARPERHWQLNEDGSPSDFSVGGRRPSMHLVPIPPSRRRKRGVEGSMELGLEEGGATPNTIINRVRGYVDEWRDKPPERWNVTYVTQKLLMHWREGRVEPRLFFCQVEAAETLIWLNEVAPRSSRGQSLIREDLVSANAEANPELFRVAAKMATGSGKTTVMAMMIAYHTINKARQPNSDRFSQNFLVVAPGITIKDRLRVLYPSDPQSMLGAARGLVPAEFMEDIKKARIVITNYHAFKRRERLKMPKATREILKGNDKADVSTVETEGQMLSRVCKELLGSKDVIVINDEAHHCYRHRVETEEEKEKDLTAEEKAEVKKSNEAARLWISGIEALKRKSGLKCVYDLSATPFFLRGSGYKEGHLFPWVVSDFSLMEAIESGIVKLPRVPVGDGTVTEDNLPIFRSLYSHVSKYLPKKGRTKQGSMDPDDLPEQLQGAIQALYSHYEKDYEAWRENGVRVPPVFIIVCNNTSTSKLVYDFVSGYEIQSRPGVWKNGKLPLFNNIGDDGKPLARMNTLLIDSEQLDSGEAMSPDFKKAAGAEIDLFKREMRVRFPDRDVSKLTDEDLLREVMNTVGKEGKLGEQIRCVVSVSMLTEGWDTNSVTHILGVRKFGTQLLCEQVVGRGLRRYTYDLNDEGRFRPEYADVFGVPFNFAKGSDPGPPTPPEPQVRVRALDERAHLAITYPRVRSYTVKISGERLVANFDKDSRMEIKPEDAPPKTEQQGIVGEGVMLTLDDLKKHRPNEVVFYLAAETSRLFRNDEGDIPPGRFRDLVPITRLWLRDYLTCLGGTFPQYLLWKPIAVKAAERIRRACASVDGDGEDVYIPIMDKFTPEGSSFYVDFMTRKKILHETREDKCHVNIAVCDSGWEQTFCEILEDDPGVHSYVRNDRLGFEVPYIYRKRRHDYRPDYIALVDDGRGAGDLLNLVVEIKGKRDDKARAKADTMKRFWIPSVNNDGRWGRWAFVESMDPQDFRSKLAEFTAGGRPTADF